MPRETRLTHYTYFLQFAIDPDTNQATYRSGWVEDNFEITDPGQTPDDPRVVVDTRRNKVDLRAAQLETVLEDLKTIHDSTLGSYFADLQRADYKLVWLEVDQTDDDITAAIGRITDDRERLQMEIWQSEGLVYGRTHSYTTKLLEITAVDEETFNAAWITVQNIPNFDSGNT